MFEGRYNYWQAVAKCVAEGGALALVTDTDTFNFLHSMLSAYRMQVGQSGAFVDGTKGVENPQSSDWYCLSTQGNCPAWPWHVGQPGNRQNERCVGVFYAYDQGLGNTRCGLEMMAMCRM